MFNIVLNTPLNKATRGTSIDKGYIHNSFFPFKLILWKLHISYINTLLFEFFHVRYAYWGGCVFHFAKILYFLEFSLCMVFIFRTARNVLIKFWNSHCEKHRNFTYFLGVEICVKAHLSHSFGRIAKFQKFPHKELRRNYGIFRGVWSKL